MLTSEQVDALWTIHDPDAGCERLRQALDQHPDSSDELHTQIARALGLQGRFAEAWDEIARTSNQPSPIAAVRIELESGRLRNSSGDRAGASPCFLKALALAEEGGFDFYAIDAAHMIAIVSEGQEAIQWNARALDLAAKSSDARARRWKGSLLNNLGWACFEMGDFDRALAAFESALAWQTTAGDPVRMRIARWTVARCLRAMQRYNEALAIQEDLSQYPEQGFVSEELGELLLVLGQPEEAKAWFAKAWKLLSVHMGSDPHEAPRLARLKELSQRTICNPGLWGAVDSCH